MEYLIFIFFVMLTGFLPTGLSQTIPPIDLTPTPHQESANVLSAGGSATCVVTKHGAVECWGDGTFTPRQINTLSSGVADVTVGETHYCVRSTVGRAQCWGTNRYGQTGDGTTTAHDTPADVIGLENNVAAITAGVWHSCAVVAGGVKCWGRNSFGALGNGTTEDSVLPVDVTDLAADVTTVVAGNNHTCALLATGGVQCWGSNSSGALGNASQVISSTVPVDVVELNSRATTLALGRSHTCALLENGSVQCWGSNLYGQLGNGTQDASNFPVSVSGLASGVTALAAWGDHTCAVVAGDVQCWGENSFGQLGDGTVTQRETPTPTQNLPETATLVATGNYHTCALTNTGQVYCWGYNGSGQIGDGLLSYQTTPVAVVGLNAPIRRVSSDQAHSCAVTTGGAAYCWGYNESAQLGVSNTVVPLIAQTPVTVTDLAEGVADIIAGDYHSCAILQSGEMMCWGSNSYGQLGNGESTASAIPVAVSDLQGVQSTAVGGYHTCAGINDGTVWCWGRNGYGQLGNGTTTDSALPAQVTTLPGRVTEVAAGDNHTCALLATGAVSCWGRNTFGQLGNGGTVDQFTPVAVSGLSGKVRALVAGSGHTCALLDTNILQCWGANGAGQLGEKPAASRPTPATVTGLPASVAMVSAGDRHTCVVAAGQLYCWGSNSDGQLGDGTRRHKDSPVAVQNFAGSVAGIAAGYRHTCAWQTTGVVYCWGSNQWGQLGNREILRLTPVAVGIPVRNYPLYLPFIQRGQ